MARKIVCVGCTIDLGEIRDATLRKGVVHICDNCNTKRMASDLKKATKDRVGNGGVFDDVFSDIFGGKI